MPTTELALHLPAGQLWVSEAARRLGVSDETIRRMIAEGSLHAIRPRRHYRVLVDEAFREAERPVHLRAAR